MNFPRNFIYGECSRAGRAKRQAGARAMGLEHGFVTVMEFRPEDGSLEMEHYEFNELDSSSPAMCEAQAHAWVKQMGALSACGWRVDLKTGELVERVTDIYDGTDLAQYEYMAEPAEPRTSRLLEA